MNVDHRFSVGRVIFYTFNVCLCHPFISILMGHQNVSKLLIVVEVEGFCLLPFFNFPTIFASVALAVKQSHSSLTKTN